MSAHTGTACIPRACASTQVPHSDHDNDFSVSGVTGAVESVRCSAGFSGGAVRTWTCGTNGVFTGEACVGDPCDASTHVAHSNRALVGSMVGSTGSSLYVECEDGYLGGGTWVCNYDGQWVGNVCSPRTCLPTQVPNSDKSETGSITGMFGSSWDVECDGNIDGGGLWTCTAFGIFSGHTCTAGQCNPIVVPHSDRDMDNIITGVTDDTQTVVCNPGYGGGGEWVCSVAGAFEGQLCLPKVCAPTEVHARLLHTRRTQHGTQHSQSEACSAHLTTF